MLTPHRDSSSELHEFRGNRDGTSHALPLDQIEQIFSLQKRIFDWWISTLLTALPWSVPRFGILVLAGAIVGIKRQGWHKATRYISELQRFRPDAFEKKVQQSAPVSGANSLEEHLVQGWPSRLRSRNLVRDFEMLLRSVFPILGCILEVFPIYFVKSAVNSPMQEIGSTWIGLHAGSEEFL